MSKPGVPSEPKRVDSTNNGDSTSNISLTWNPPVNTGSVYLTGYKLYMKDITANSISVSYDGSSSAAVTSATITYLVLNQNYEIWVTALNPLESDTINSTILTAAALPTAPSAISVVTRTSDTLQLSRVATSNDGGSPVLAYTLVEDAFDDQ